MSSERPVVDKLQNRVTRNAPGVLTGPGWDGILEWVDATIAAIFPRYEIQQVAAKFGTLRYYTNVDTDPAVRVIVNEAEDISTTECEDCGEYGSIRVHGWVRALCDDCYETVLRGRLVEGRRTLDRSGW